jgi:hypothetical protein
MLGIPVDLPEYRLLPYCRASALNNSIQPDDDDNNNDKKETIA